MDRRNLILWVLQWVFGVLFIVVGVMHFIVPEGLPGPMSWMYDLDDTLHRVSGTAEILGGLGLLLPGLTRVLPVLTPLAAFGLVIVMLGAIVWHAGRGEVQQIVLNLIYAALLAYVGLARLLLRPLPTRRA